MQIKFGNRKHDLKTVLNVYIKSILISIAVVAIRTATTHRKDESIVILSHTLSGNALAFTLWMNEHHPDIKISFATDSPEEYIRLTSSLQPPLKLDKIFSLQSFKDTLKLSRTSVVLSTHGPLTLYYWKYLNRNKRPTFFDCWHGVGFKGGLAKGINSDLYQAVFVSSEYFADLHRRWGLNNQKIKITGYSRTDRLLNNDPTRDEILQSFNINQDVENIGLIAPTWTPTPDDENFLLDTNLEAFLKQLDTYAEENNCLFIFRMHLNNKMCSLKDTYKRVQV